MMGSQILAGIIASLEGPALDAAIIEIMAGQKGDEAIAWTPDAPEAALIAVARGGSLRARQVLANRTQLPDTVTAILATDRAASIAGRFGAVVPQKSRKQPAPAAAVPDRSPAEAIRANDPAATAAALLDGAPDSDVSQALKEALLVDPTRSPLPTQRRLLTGVAATIGVELAAQKLVGLSSTWGEAVDTIGLIVNSYDYGSIERVANAAGELLLSLPGQPADPVRLPRWETRQFIAALPSTPPDVLEALIVDPDADVRATAGCNGRTPLQAVSDAVFDDRELPSFSWLIRIAKLSPSEAAAALADLQPLAILNALVLRKPLSEAAFAAAATGPLVLRLECAANTLAPAGILELLAVDKDYRVAGAVQRNDAAPSTAIVSARASEPFWPAYARVADEDLPGIPWMTAVAAIETVRTVDYPEQQAVRIRDTVARLMSTAELRTPGAVACMSVLADEYDGTLRGLIEAGENL